VDNDEQTIVLEVKLAFSAISRTIKKYFMAAINVLSFEDGLGVVFADILPHVTSISAQNLLLREPYFIGI